VGKEAEGSSGLRSQGESMGQRVLLMLMLFLLATDAAAQSHDGLAMTCRIPRKGREGPHDLVRPMRADEKVLVGTSRTGCQRMRA
jgi:hypothetical protein